LIILGVKLHNIRSYKDATIVFPPRGITTVYGDIGSGKTTILMAISYALFGTQTGGGDYFARYAYPKPEDLLRSGYSYGYVRLALLHQGKYIVVERRVKKTGGSIGDDGGWIKVYTIEDSKLKLVKSRPGTAGELKRLVIDELGLEEYVKSKERKARIYTQAIYVPQFNIHEIMEMEADERLKMINIALGIEKYNNIKININELIEGSSSPVKAELKTLESMEKKYSDELNRIDKDRLEKEITDLQVKLREINERIANLEIEKKKLEEKKEELQSKRKVYEVEYSRLKEEKGRLDKLKQDMDRITSEISKLSSQLGLTGIDIQDLGKLRGLLDGKRSELEDKLKEFEKTKDRLTNTLNELEARKDDLNREISESKSSKARIETEIKNIKEQIDQKKRELEEISELVKKGICPVCKQRIHPGHAEDLIRRINDEIDRLNNSVGIKEKELENVKSRLNELNDMLNKVSNDIKDIKQHLNDTDSALKQIRDQLMMIDRLIDLSNQLVNIMEGLKASSSIEDEIKHVEESISSIENEIRRVEEEIKRVYNRIIELNSEKAGLEERVKSIMKDLDEYERIRKELEKIRADKKRYENLRDLLNKLVDLVDNIEKSVRANIYQYFREVFTKYFNMLMEDYEALIVDVNPDFNVSYKANIDKETRAIPHPSGGQVISVSLAYRLALNTVIRMSNPELKDITLILDEPTTGFSPERVEKLQRLLREMGSGAQQIIIVTHDEKLRDIGDCKIKLTLDQTTHTTRVDYTECTIQQLTLEDYRKFVETLLT